MVKMCWEKRVTSNTVINCFGKAGFVSDRFSEVEELHDENQELEAGDTYLTTTFCQPVSLYLKTEQNR